MVKLAILFLILSFVAGMLGYSQVAGAALTIAKVLFGFFLAAFVVTVLLAVYAVQKLKSKI